ncbi:hypothetical protein [Embleya sp. NPDC005971]|uniref:hypothetical protein n=1 Tax=Embleya sp. NPDC005971 TaxID=3156724 RepID=UPI0033C7DCAD
MTATARPSVDAGTGSTSARRGTATLRHQMGGPRRGGWYLDLDHPDITVRPPRRGMPPQAVGAWLTEVLAEHGWALAEHVSWPPPFGDEGPPRYTDLPITRTR